MWALRTRCVRQVCSTHYVVHVANRDRSTAIAARGQLS
nr:hypothetical protein BN444_00097 [Xanthomonas translucens pv. translucens DSM 18974]